MFELSSERLANGLATRRYGRSLQYVASTESTNDDARSAIEATVPSGHVILADTQSRGRGSRGRSWASPPGTDLYLSIVDRLPDALPGLPPLTLAVGLGVAEAANRLLGETGNGVCQVKWPNDVLIADRKCAGILVEASTGLHGQDALVIGIGLNLNRSHFPDELREQATSLLLAGASQPFDRTDALVTLLGCVEHWVDCFVDHGPAYIAEALTPKLALLGRRARCGETIGLVRGVEPSGALRMETSDGMRSVIAGKLEALD